MKLVVKRYSRAGKDISAVCEIHLHGRKLICPYVSIEVIQGEYQVNLWFAEERRHLFTAQGTFSMATDQFKSSWKEIRILLLEVMKPAVDEYNFVLENKHIESNPRIEEMLPPIV